MNPRMKVTSHVKSKKEAPSSPIIGRTTAPDSPEARLLFLQRTIGNRAVRELCRNGMFQAKSKIGETGDIYEQEADRVANQVLQIPKPQVNDSNGVSGNIQRVRTRINAPMLSRWKLDDTLKILCPDPDGQKAINLLNSEKYSVYTYDSYTRKRQYYTDATKTTKDGPPKHLETLGYHNRSAREVAFKEKRSDEDVASTFVHELTHANQHKEYEDKKKVDLTAKPPSTAEKEYGAHIKQEEFNIRNNIPSKSASFRKLESGKWVVDVDAIKKWVDTVYAIGPDKYYDEFDEKLDGKKGPIGPWICP